MTITKYKCEKIGGEVIEKDKKEYCIILISKRLISEERIKKFKDAVNKCKGQKLDKYRACMSMELKRR